MKTALLSNNPQFRAFASSIDTGIIVCNKAGLIVDFNDTIRKMFKYRDDEIRGKPITMLMPSRFHEFHTQELVKYNAEGENNVVGHALRMYGLDKHQDEFPIEIHVSAWNDIDGLEYFTVSLRRYSQLEKNLGMILLSTAVMSVVMLITLVILAARTF
ncbi:PAS domain S-box protein [Acinetobacter sp.]|uniref:PAS domain S-box protein n=1 Tax=Acinetobacter sp. TaxID=472 RepID=UPI003890FDBB